jgi:lipopolysaccharide export system ATP-binding protein
MDLPSRHFHEQAFRPADRLLSVDDVTVVLNGKSVLAGVSLDVAAGEIVGLLGRDGAGKTACFQAISGLIRTTSGRVWLNGADVTNWPADRRARHGLAYLPEGVSIFRGLTCEDNIRMALESPAASDIDAQGVLEKLLEDFELTVVRHQSAISLSGGERRRCEVARSMALKPSIMMLDEPFKGLDPTSIASTMRMIASLRERGVGVLVSDYDLPDLLALLDRVYLLHQGQLIFSGSVDMLLSNSDVRRVYLGEAEGHVL